MMGPLGVRECEGQCGSNILLQSSYGDPRINSRRRRYSGVNAVRGRPPDLQRVRPKCDDCARN